MSGKSVLITGCSAGGIGSALVEAFQKRNVHVFASARSLEKMSHLAKLPNVTLLTLDVTVSESIYAALEIVRDNSRGKLDFLINNSGAHSVMPALDMDINAAKALFEVNFWGVFAVSQAFAPLLIAAKGSIANMSSISGILYAPWMSIYNASKAALTMLSETLRLEMAPFDVKVVTIITGIVETKIMTNSPEVRLPETSKYAVIKEAIVRRAKGEDVTSNMKMKPEEFAEKVVGDLLGGVSGKIYRGQSASVIHYAAPHMPTSILDSTLIKGTGLDIFPKTQ